MMMARDKTKKDKGTKLKPTQNNVVIIGVFVPVKAVIVISETKLMHIVPVRAIKPVLLMPIMTRYKRDIATMKIPKAMRAIFSIGL